jgi:hypothetical protein
MGPSFGVAVGLEPRQDDTHVFSRASKNGGGYTPLIRFLKSSILEKTHVHLVQNEHRESCLVDICPKPC